MNTTIEKTEDKVSERASDQRWLKPRYAVRSFDDHHEVRVTMPGVNKSGLDVSMEGNLLHILGHRDDLQLVNPTWRPALQELPRGDFRLDLELNVHIDEGKIEANVRDGVLYLNLPIAEAAKPRRIEIK